MMYIEITKTESNSKMTIDTSQLNETLKKIIEHLSSMKKINTIMDEQTANKILNERYLKDTEFVMQNESIETILSLPDISNWVKNTTNQINLTV